MAPRAEFFMYFGRVTGFRYVKFLINAGLRSHHWQPCWNAWKKQDSSAGSRMVRTGGKPSCIWQKKQETSKMIMMRFHNEMTDIYYQGFSASEIGQFESYLDRIRENLEGWGIKWAFALKIRFKIWISWSAVLSAANTAMPETMWDAGIWSMISQPRSSFRTSCGSWISRNLRISCWPGWAICPGRNRNGWIMCLTGSGRIRSTSFFSCQRGRICLI